MNSRFLYTVCLLCGVVVGLAFGDCVFPELEAMLGEFLGDALFAAGGTLLGAILHRIVMAEMRARVHASL